MNELNYYKTKIWSRPISTTSTSSTPKLVTIVGSHVDCAANFLVVQPRALRACQYLLGQLTQTELLVFNYKQTNTCLQFHLMLGNDESNDGTQLSRTYLFALSLSIEDLDLMIWDCIHPKTLTLAMTLTMIVDDSISLLFALQTKVVSFFSIPLGYGPY